MFLITSLLDWSLKKYLFISWLCWVFIAIGRLSLVVASGDDSLDVVCGLLTVVASLVQHRLYSAGLQQLWLAGSRVRAQ